ncbi:MAG: hypothetical protein LAO31_09880 [Acidobacteriia bacterium]|nr:hypothetical protein [Terriglobia bacterium]
MSNTVGLSVFILAVILFLGWFAVGTQLNIRKGERILRWLQDGLRLAGEKATLRWLGSSAVELKVQKPKAPFHHLEIFIVLEPRDVPFIRWFFRARGRRDLLIVRIDSSDAPRFELEVMDEGAWSTRDARAEVRRKHWAWSQIETGPGSALTAYAQGVGAAEATPRLLGLATLPGCTMVRLAVHSATPHLEVQWHLDGLEKLPSQQIFEKLHQMAELL